MSVSLFVFTENWFWRCFCDIMERLLGVAMYERDKGGGMAMVTTAERVAPEDLQRWLENGEDVVCLDVLLPDVFDARRIAGARSACVYEVEFPEHVQGATTGFDQRIVLYGEDEHTLGADVAAEKLGRMGYSDVRVLAGGIAGWLKRGFPVEGTGLLPPEDGLRLVEGVFAVDAEESRIEWVGRNAGKRHTGTLQVSRGRLDVRDGGMHGEFVVPLSTLRNTDLEDDSLRRLLVAHLLSDDFFFAEAYSEVRYSLDAAVPLHGAMPGTATHDVRGHLEVRGQRHPLALRATFANLPDGAYAVEAHCDFDRTAWGVLYGSGRFFKYLGYHLVYDIVSVQLRMVLRPVTA
jgi:rhodanese-related sulfurtransferase/polyisoprenoid-binding protein YceI